MYKNDNNSTKSNGSFKPSKPIKKSIELVATGEAGHGRKYNVDSLKSLLLSLDDACCFNRLSVMATMPKSIVFNNPEAYGTVSVARVNGYDSSANRVIVTFFGKNLPYADLLDGSMAMTVRVHVDRESNVDSILSFDIIKYDKDESKN